MVKTKEELIEVLPKFSNRDEVYSYEHLDLIAWFSMDNPGLFLGFYSPNGKCRRNVLYTDLEVAIDFYNHKVFNKEFIDKL